jgi:hypothetical protein
VYLKLTLSFPESPNSRTFQFLNSSKFKDDGFVKSPSAALRFTFVVAAYLLSTPHSSGFARLASGAFYFAIGLRTFYEIIKDDFHHCPNRKFKINKKYD